MIAMDASALILCAAMAVAAGLVGCFAVMRRMTLAADAFAHVALPGIGLALVLGFHPLTGALAALLAGGLLIWAIEGKTKLSTEAITGVVFSVALAIGSLTTSGEELMDALFGAPGTLRVGESAFGLVAALAVIGFIVKARDHLLVSLISTEVATASGIGVARLHLSFLIAFSVTVALGMRYLGVLLMGSLIIIPATVARRMARSIDGMLAIATAAALVSTLTGTWIAALTHRPSGPLIVTIAGGLFFLSLLKA
jgi:ABC-type Mn2+/Zn2+ transport system permease subunit